MICPSGHEYGEPRASKAEYDALDERRRVRDRR